MIYWHDFVVVEIIDDEDEELPIPMTLDEVIRRSKISALGGEEPMQTAEPGKEMKTEMDQEEMQFVEEGMKAARLDVNATEAKAPGDEPEPRMRIVKNWKRPEERIPAERDPTWFVISPITNELISISEMAEHMRISLIDPKYKEQKERMMAKIRETTLAADDEISKNIVGLARTRPDIFGTTEEEVSNAVEAEIEKKRDEQPKQDIWDGHSGSIGRTATQALSQSASGEEQTEANNNDSRILLGPAPQPRPGVPLVRSLPPPPGLALNIPRFPPNTVPYSVPAAGGGLIPHPRPGMIPVILSVRPCSFTYSYVFVTVACYDEPAAIASSNFGKPTSTSWIPVHAIGTSPTFCYEASVPEVLTAPVAYHVVILRRSLRGPCGEARGVHPTTGERRSCPPYPCQVGRMTADPPMLVSGRLQSRRVGHVIGPAIRGRGDVAARSPS
ncbi:hypothetical protein GW17_00032972, partial [Ensete ventricosum]